METTVSFRSIENRAMAIALRVGVATVGITLMAITANAQTLLNTGFESGTPPTPTSWTLFNFAYMTGTNCPPDGNNSCTNLTVHSGAYSLKTFGPYNVDFDASGAYQDFTGVTIGDTWKVAGYALNWSLDPLTGTNGWGMGQILFLDGGGGTITNFDSAHLGTDSPLPVDKWVAFQAVGKVPAGTVTMRVQVLHVGIAGAGGSVWFDDITLAKRTGTTNVLAATAQPGVRVSFPTTPPMSYQVQTTTNLSTSTIWSNFGAPIVGSSYTNQVFDPYGASPNKFYRIVPQ